MLLANLNNRNRRWRTFNSIFKKCFIYAESGGYPVRKTQTILLFFSKLSNSFDNLQDVSKFLVDIGCEMRYNRGRRLYKNLSCKLSDETLSIILEEQKFGKFNKAPKRIKRANQNL